jgi:hypothetical protein
VSLAVRAPRANSKRRDINRDSESSCLQSDSGPNTVIHMIKGIRSSFEVRFLISMIQGYPRAKPVWRAVAAGPHVAVLFSPACFGEIIPVSVRRFVPKRSLHFSHADELSSSILGLAGRLKKCFGWFTKGFFARSRREDEV